MSNTPENKSGMPVLCKGAGHVFTPTDGLTIEKHRDVATRWGYADTCVEYHDSRACAEKMEKLRALIEAVDGNDMTDGVHGNPCSYSENEYLPCSWCEFKADILALLDAAEGKAPEGGV